MEEGEFSEAREDLGFLEKDSPSGFVVKGSGTIGLTCEESSCPEHCNKCSGPSECTECKDSYVLFDSECSITECPSGFVVKGSGTIGLTCEESSCGEHMTHCNKCSGPSE